MDNVQYDLLFKYILVGDASVGKSTILGMFVDNRYRDQNQPTLGVQFASRRIQLNQQIIKLQIWDTAGQQAFRTITRAYYKNTIGVILVFDINQRRSYQSLHSWLEQIKQYSNPNVEIIIVANKIDLNKAQVSCEQIQKLNLPYFCTSAKTGENINDPFMELTEKIQKRVNNNEIDTSDPKSGVKRSQNQNINRDVNLKLVQINKKKQTQQCSC